MISLPISLLPSLRCISHAISAHRLRSAITGSGGAERDCAAASFHSHLMSASAKNSMAASGVNDEQIAKISRMRIFTSKGSVLALTGCDSRSTLLGELYT